MAEPLEVPQIPVQPVPAIVTTAELAALLRISPTQVRRLHLPAIELARGRWRYVTDQVLDELRKRAARGALGTMRRSA